MVDNLVLKKEISKQIGKSPNFAGRERDVSYFIFEGLKCPECNQNTAFLSIEVLDEYSGNPIIIVGCSTDSCIFRTELLKNMKKKLYSLDISWREYILKY